MAEGVDVDDRPVARLDVQLVAKAPSASCAPN
jgi:hypothetical protein